MADPKHRVTPLPDGTFRVVTTFERILTRKQMEEVDIPVPRQEVPWESEQAGPTPAQLRVRSPEAEARIALGFWIDNLGGFDRRLPKELPRRVREFGLGRVLDAFKELKAQNIHGDRYLRLQVLFDRMREGDL